MASWSQRRRYLYALIVTVVLVGVVFIPAFLFFYKAPTCYDGLQNGNEQGVDCGGSCERLCQSAFLPPDVAWTRYEQIAPGLYNLAAYIINPNTNGEAKNVPYHMVIFDKTGVPIADASGVVTLPPHRNTLAFIGAVDLGKSLPAASPLFEFTQAPNWHKASDPLSALVIGDKNYSEDASGSSLQVSLKNSSPVPLSNLSVYTVLFDQDKNAIGFSRTSIDSIGPSETVIAPFTWPNNRHGQVISQEVLPVQE